AQQQAAERAVAVGRHEDQIAMLLVSILDDRSRRIAIQQDTPGVQTGELRFEKSVDAALCPLAPLRDQVIQDGGSYFHAAEFDMRRQNMKQDDLGLKPSGEWDQVAGSAARPFGKVDGQQNFRYFQHDAPPTIR